MKSRSALRKRTPRPSNRGMTVFLRGHGAGDDAVGLAGLAVRRFFSTASPLQQRFDELAYALCVEAGKPIKGSEAKSPA